MVLHTLLLTSCAIITAAVVAADHQLLRQQDPVEAARPQLSLDGQWDFRCDNGTTGIISVPQWWDAPKAGGWQCLTATYSRTVTVPADDPRWINRSLRLRFASVDQVATVFVDGQKRGEHVGGGLAFTVPVGPGVAAGQSFAVRVEVQGGALPPITPANRDGRRCGDRDRETCSGPPTNRNNCTWDGALHGGFCVGVPAWPVGWYGQEQRWGIGDSVTLQAYGASVSLVDTCFARANPTRTTSLLVNCTLRNQLSVAASVQLQVKGSPKRSSRASGRGEGDGLRGGGSDMSLRSGNSPLFSQFGVTVPTVTTLPPFGIREVQIEVDWDGEMWFPDSPALYNIATCVLLLAKDGSTKVVDSEVTVLGFKHVAVEGTRLVLNGRRLNLRGTSIHPSQDYRTVWGAGGLMDTLPSTVCAWKRLGVNVLRVHQGPAPENFLVACDELGLMIIEESAVYARGYVIRSPVQELYVQNSKSWVRQWVRQRRQHPSITLWSAENENGIAFRKCVPNGECYSALSDSEIALLAATVHENDGTRPVGCDGDQIGSKAHLPAAPAYSIVNYHYPEGYGKSWGATQHSIYLPLQTVGRPNAVGEFVSDYSSTGGADNKLWHGLVVRGLRYTGYSDIRPYTLKWALEPPTLAVSGLDLRMAAETLRRSLSAVAVFDYAYDDLGPVPNFKQWPSLADGAQRKFVVYNDEFVGGARVATTLTLRSNETGRVLGVGHLVLNVTTGEHVEFECSFSRTRGRKVATTSQQPGAAARTAGGEIVDLLLTAAKNGIGKFQEVRRFSMVGSSPLVTIACEV